MVQGIVVPSDGGGAVRVQELAGLSEFQEVAGGWIEPIELEGVDATIYVNGAIQRERAVFNSRATALRWFYGRSQDWSLLLGDVIITGSDSGASDASLPRIIHGLLIHHEFVVQISPDERSWYDTPLRFPSIFEAALWALLFDSTLVHGSEVRIEALDSCSEHKSGARSW